MFDSGFSEGSESAEQPSLNFGTKTSFDTDIDEPTPTAEGLVLSLMRQFEDSDDEEDDDDDGSVALEDKDEPGRMCTMEGSEENASSEGIRPPSSAETTTSDVLGLSWTNVGGIGEGDMADPDYDRFQHQRNVRAKLSHPSTPRGRDMEIEQDDPINASGLRSHDITESRSTATLSDPEASTSGSRKMQVVVRDVAYATYRAVLYYVRVAIFSPSMIVHDSTAC